MYAGPVSPAAMRFADLSPWLSLRRRTLLPLPSAATAELPALPADAAYMNAFARFLNRNVARPDNTRATYAVHVATWLAWCRGTDLELASATIDDVED